MLYLLDAFNEMPEHLQRTAVGRALDLDPIEPTARWMLALALLRHGDVPTACVAADDAHRLDALLLSTPKPWVRGELAALNGQGDDGAAEVRAALPDGPS